MVIVEPGYSCTVYGPPGSPMYYSIAMTQGAADNEGWHYQVRDPHSEFPVIGSCGGSDLRRLQVFKSKGPSTTQVFAYIDERCADPATGAIDTVRNFQNGKSYFDEEIGHILVALVSECQNPCPEGHAYQEIQAIAISGFTTTFEILHSYTPATNTISFRVPYMPEGMPGADWFDTYWGDLATVGDWSQAKPLQCAYPPSTPMVGDYLTVEDTLPTLTPGRGYYYVTAATYMGETRYGRRSSGGTLTGRDPAVLPACE